MCGMTKSSEGVSPYVRDLSETLLTRSGELGAELAELIKATDIRYRDEHVVSTADLVRSCSDNIEMIFCALAGLPSPRAEGPRETGRRRAEQGMPLAVTLRGYRIGGRFIWNVLLRSSDDSPASRDALLRAAEVIWTVVDDFSEALSDAFRDAIAERALVRQREHGGRLPEGRPVTQAAVQDTAQHRRAHLGVAAGLVGDGIPKGVAQRLRIVVDDGPDHLRGLQQRLAGGSRLV